MSLKPPTEGTPSTESVANSVLDSRLDVVESSIVGRINAYAAEAPYTAVKADGTTDDTAAINSLLDRHRGKRIVFPYLNLAGSRAAIKTTDTLFAWTDTDIVAFGVLWQPSGLTGHAIKFGDAPFTPTSPKALTVDAVKGTTTVTVSTTDAATFAAGDMVRVDDQELVGGQAIYHEPNYVDSVNTGTGVVTLRAPLLRSYTVATTAAITKIVTTRGQNVKWRGGFWDMSAVTTGGSDRSVFALYYNEHSIVREVACANHPYKLYQQWDCVDSHLYDAQASKPAYSGYGQGYLGTLSGRGNSMENCWGLNVRHTGDIVNGSDNAIARCRAIGRPGGTGDGQQTGFLMHGFGSQNCKIVDCVAVNTVYGFGAGNPSFEADYDFEMVNCTAVGCQEGFFIAYGCTGFKISGRAISCSSRGFMVDNNSEGEVDLICDGCGTASNGFGSFMVTASTIRGKVKVRNSKERAISVTGLFNVDLDVDVDLPSTANTGFGVSASSVTTGSTFRLRGKLNGNNATHNAVNLAMPSGVTADVEVQTSGTWQRALSSSGGATDVSVGGRFRGTYSEQIRADAGELIIKAGTSFSSSGTAVRAATSTAKVTFLGPNHWNGVATRFANTSSATVVNGEDVVRQLLAQTLSVGGAVSLNPTNADIQRVTLQANASSLTFSSGIFDGQPLQVEMIQDATGSRTFTWPTSNARYAGGAAPAATTTANRRDVLRFRWNATDSKWDEQSRSLAVG